jgi:hypothetical protein
MAIFGNYKEHKITRGINLPYTEITLEIIPRWKRLLKSPLFFWDAFIMECGYPEFRKAFKNAFYMLKIYWSQK